jgi:hypothetical protein
LQGAIQPSAVRICEPALMLDRLRWIFPYAVAVMLPLAGAVMAVMRYTQDDRDDALRIALATFIGVCLYGLLLR